MRVSIPALLLTLAACGPTAAPTANHNAAESLVSNVAVPGPEANSPSRAEENGAGGTVWVIKTAVENRGDPRDLPTDVQQFIARYDACEHWLGEPDFDAARRRQIARAVSQSCRGIDAAADLLRSRYMDNAMVFDRLREYYPLGQ